MEDRVVGLGPDDLRRMPCGEAVAGESGKARAILGTLNTGIVDAPATCTANARTVLALDVDEPRAS
jgi:DNA-binding transcriptional regulator LsrR (DeoR family)